MIVRVLGQVGFDTSLFSGISARNGGLSTAMEAGVSEHILWMQSGHAQDASARRYVQLRIPSRLYDTWASFTSTTNIFLHQGMVSRAGAGLRPFRSGSLVAPGAVTSQVMASRWPRPGGRDLGRDRRLPALPLGPHPIVFTPRSQQGR